MACCSGLITLAGSALNASPELQSRGCDLFKLRSKTKFSSGSLGSRPCCKLSCDPILFPSPFCKVRAMAETSVAYFREACVGNEVLDLHQQLCDFGWRTMVKFAFSSSYIPGQPDDSKFIEKVVKRLGLTEDDTRVSGLRRLFFEAYTVAASEMRRRRRRRAEGKRKCVAELLYACDARARQS